MMEISKERKREYCIKCRTTKVFVCYRGDWVCLKCGCQLKQLSNSREAK